MHKNFSANYCVFFILLLKHKNYNFVYYQISTHTFNIQTYLDINNLLIVIIIYVVKFGQVVIQ